MGTGGVSAPAPPRGPRVIRQFRQPLTASRRSPLAWQPWKPTPVPSGYYNPTLDAEQGASERGTADATADTLTGLIRNNSDYGLTKGNFEREEGEGLSKIGTARTQEQQDTQRALGELSEAYKRLGGRQEEQQNEAGVLNGGAVLQAAQKRAANEQREAQPIKQTDERNLAQLGLQQQELESGTQRSLGDLALHQGSISPQVLRLVGELSNPSARANAQEELGKLESTPGDAGLLGGRVSQDLVTKLVRAERENAQFGVNVAAQKAREAAQLGYVPPAKPGNEHQTKAGVTYHTISHGHEWWDVTPTGQVIKKRHK